MNTPTAYHKTWQSSAKPSRPRKAAEADKSRLNVGFDDSVPGVQRVLMPRDDILCTLFHTEDPAQASALWAHCLRTIRADELSGDGVADNRGFMIGVVRDLAPRDVVERLLATQLAVTHVAAARAACRTAAAEHLPQIEAHTSAYVKLARVFMGQMEALKRHRSKWQQVVRLERVNVEPGGQAIVGTVQHGGRGAVDES